MAIDILHLEKLKNIAGPKGYSTDPDVIEPHLKEPREKFIGKSPLVLYPDSTEKVSALVHFAYEHDIKLVPQSGNTGLVGGGVPDASGNEIIISLKRMNRVRVKDNLNHTMTVESGMILADAHNIATSMDMIFPMHLASEGSAMIGGNISSNAGGINVLHYGVMRDLVLGLEVVLPNGDIWNGLTGLRKDNTGYDLKQLFIGAEGTLGIITAATLKLFPAHKQKNTAFVAIQNPEAAIKLLNLAREISGDSLIAFEILPRIGLDMTIKHMPGCRDPLDQSYPWYILMECATSLNPDLLDLEKVMERILETAMEAELVIDGVVPKNMNEANDLWKLREFMSEAQKFEGGSIKHDIAVPVSKIPEFLKQAVEAVMQALPGVRPVPFGHIGDGNIHFNLSQPVNMNKQDYLKKWPDLNRVVHDIVTELGGSISAEHGIGTLKVGELEHYKPETDLKIMRDIKKTIDPKNIMNPGRIIRV
ncbi:MAG: FAD-binding oxidoreductase [Emcibacteraceae bacterium]